jgi:pyridoxamine 5'-phosphate oxidase
MSFEFKSDPLDSFSKLFREAQLKGIPEHNAISLATVGKDGKPSNRIVYFKGLVRGGFSFFTNYSGRKGLDIQFNPNVSAQFYWPHLDQQVHIEGKAEKLTESESDKYFSTRPRNSQIGAWASLQSQELTSYSEFEARFQKFEKQYESQKVPRPPHWGGFLIVPDSIEFWFGRSGRLHERYVFNRENLNSQWKRFMRYP